MSSINPADVQKAKSALFHVALSFVLSMARIFIQAAVFRSIWSWYITPVGYAAPATSLVFGGLLLWSLIDGYPSIADSWSIRDMKSKGVDLEFLQEQVRKGFSNSLLIMMIVWFQAWLLHVIFF